MPRSASSVDLPAPVRIGTLPVHPLTFNAAIDQIVRLAESGRGGTVYTPNVDHVVRAERDDAFRAAYQHASLSIPDGMPVVWASHALGTPLPARVSGSEWLEPLLAKCARRHLGVYLLGGRMGAASAARTLLQERYPGLRIVGVGPRTRDIEADRRLLDAACADIRALRPHIVVVALGSPLQELWSQQVRQQVGPAVLMGLGSALDLLAGLVSRPPRWMSHAGLEWAYRLVLEPRRLWRRYLLGGPAFARVIARQRYRQRATAATSESTPPSTGLVAAPGSEQMVEHDLAHTVLVEPQPVGLAVETGLATQRPMRDEA